VRLVSKTCLGPIVKLLEHLFLQENVDFFLSHDVDVSQKHHVLALDSLVCISMDLLSFLE